MLMNRREYKRYFSLGNKGTLPVTLREQDNISFKTYGLGNIGQFKWNFIFGVQGNSGSYFQGTRAH